MSVEYKFTSRDLKVLRGFIDEIKETPDVKKMQDMTSPWWKLFVLDKQQIEEYAKDFKHHRICFDRLFGEVWYVERAYVDDVLGVCAMLQFGDTVRLTESQYRSLLKVGIRVVRSH